MHDRSLTKWYSLRHNAGEAVCSLQGMRKHQTLTLYEHSSKALGRGWKTDNLGHQDNDGRHPLQSVVHGDVQVLQAHQRKRHVPNVQQRDWHERPCALLVHCWEVHVPAHLRSRSMELVRLQGLRRYLISWMRRWHEYDLESANITGRSTISW